LLASFQVIVTGPGPDIALVLWVVTCTVVPLRVVGLAMSIWLVPIDPPDLA